MLFMLIRYESVLQEFLLYINLTSDASATEKLEGSFKIFDIDNNGQITQVELFRVIKALLSMTSGTTKNGVKMGRLMKRL